MPKIAQQNTLLEVKESILSPLSSHDFYYEVDRGNIPGFTSKHIIGNNPSVTTSLVPITTSGFYRTPTSATALEVVSNNVNDTSAGTGARSVNIEFINAAGYLDMQTVNMNGLTAVPLPINCFRVLGMSVKDSGTYGTQSAGSHAGTLTLRESGGGQTWCTIVLGDGFPLGETQIACYTVPKGYTAYILSINHSVDSSKTVNLYFFKRENIFNVSAPYGPIICKNAYNGLTGFSTFQHLTKEAFSECTDFGFMGILSSGTGGVTLEMEIHLVKNNNK